MRHARNIWAGGLILFIFAYQLPVSVCSADIDSQRVNLDSLIITSLGGSSALTGIQNLTSIQTTGHIRLNNQDGEFRTIVVPPNKFYNEIKFPDFSLIQGYDGTTAWQRNYNGRYTPVTGYERDEMLKELYFETFAFLKNDHIDSTVTYCQRMVLDNIPYHQVGFLPHDSLDTVYVYFAVENGERRMSLSKLDNAVTMTYISQYRTVDGIIFPSAGRIVAPAVGVDISTETIQIILNQPVTDSLFSPPLGALADFRFPADSASITVPIAYQNGHLFVHAKVNGTRKVRFILDTGASTNIFSPRLAADASLSKAGSLPAKGVSGFSSVDLVKIDSIEIGGVTLFEQVGGCLDVAQLMSLSEDSTEYLGILGYDFLSHFPMLVQYHDQMLTLFNPATFTPPDNGTTVPFTLSMLIPTVQAEINGVSGEFLLDLGNALGVIVHPYYANKNGIDASFKNRQKIEHNIGGVGGFLPGETAVVDSFRIGAISRSDFTITLPEESEGLTGSEVIAGNIGNEFLQNYSVLIDYSNNRLIFYPAIPQ